MSSQHEQQISMTPMLRMAGPTLAATLTIMAGCQTPLPTTVAAVGEVRPAPGILNGYLDRKVLPDSLALLPKPPVPGSAQAAADLEVHKDTRALRGTPRWQIAAQDNELKFPEAAAAFACALDLDISERATLHLNMLLRHTLVEAGLATYRAKDTYNRKRPFVELGESTCAPTRKAGSSRTALARRATRRWAGRGGLVLAGLAPERTDALV